MVSIAVLLIAVALLVSYANGANDNFKGVATLYGSGTLSYRTALSVATVATLIGSFASAHLAAALLGSFHGVGLVPASLAGSQRFVLATGTGAAATVLIATAVGIPISTTHALLGAMVGVTLASGAMPNWPVLGRSFVAPLLFSPLAVMPITGLVYLAGVRLAAAGSAGQDRCFCVGDEIVGGSVLPGGIASGLTVLTATVASEAECDRRYVEAPVRVSLNKGLDWLHVLSAAAVSFSRGVNDTPKIAALLVLSPFLAARESVFLVAVTIALGGLLSARSVAETMSRQITRLEPRGGLAANLATAFMVLVASRWGMPVSTTHVSCGALFGLGALSGEARWRIINGIIGAWLVTVPLAASLGAVSILGLRWM